MSAFAAAAGVIFRDRNISVAAVWRAAGVPPDVPVRIVLRQPDVQTEFSDVRLQSGTLVLDVQARDVAVPAKGDTCTVGTAIYRVVNAPQVDGLGLIWSMGVVAAA